MKQPSIIFGDQFESAPEWKVPEPEELPYLTGVTRLSMDTETSSKNPFTCKLAGISIGYRNEMLDVKTLYAPVGHSEGNMDPEVVRNWLQYVLPGKEVVFANAKFDIPVLRRFGIDLEALGVLPRDVTFPDALLDDNRRAGRSLEELGQRYVGRGKLQTDLDKNRMAEYPSWMVGPYAEGDAGVTLEVDEATEPLLEAEGLEKVAALEYSIIYAVCEIERNGCRLDVEKLERWRKEVRAAYEKTVMSLYRQTGMMVDPGSGGSMARLFKHLGIEPPVRIEKKKQGQTKKEFEAEQAKQAAEGSEKKKQQPPYEVEELIALKHPVINQVVEARQLDSLLSKFLDKYHDGLDGDILRSQFHQLKSDEGGTVRGRFSSSGGGDLSSGFGFNSQQVIKTKKQKETTGDRWIVRELFIPDDGQKYFSADASQIEYRIAAALANAQKIIAAYRDDPKADFHDLVEQRIKQYKPSHNDRTITKNTNFAYVFGAGPEKLAATAGISVREATELLGICKKIFPEAPDLLKNLSEQAKIKGFVTTLFGRRARFGPKDRHYAALNACVQGSAADIFKKVFKAVYDERKTLGIHKLRQIVHDEVDGDRIPGEVYEKRMLEFFNEQRVDLSIPIVWNITGGQNWAECH